MSKQELRQLIRQRKRQFSQQKLEELSLDITARLLAHERVKAAKTILLYYSLDDEVNTHALIDTLYGQGKTLMLPEVKDDNSMVLRIYQGTTSMRCGAFGILESTGELFDDYEDIDIAVIPGMAFDANGHRLGRGKGYYDRFLILLPHCYKIGMCFDFQRVDYVPTESTDISVDEII